MTIEITLPTEFTQDHASALGQYFQSETRPSQLEEVLEILPDVAEIRVDTQELVVVEYQQWKERVKTRQERGE